jgi:glutaconate CoA-transferase subunit B
MDDYSIKELMACWLSRDLADGERLLVGANFPVARAAVLLAHFLHGPNMDLQMGTFRVNLDGVDRAMTSRYLTDFRPILWADAMFNFPVDMFGFHNLDAFFISGIQIDAHGNTNLIGLPGQDKKYKFRGPGSIGTSTLAAVAGRYYIVTERHSPKIFVEKCDLVSAVGFGDGTPGLRDQLAYPGQGPKYCLTPLCVFDFSEDTNRMRLHSLHPGVIPDQVRENTGFDVEIPDNVLKTKPPTPQELEVLRTRVDPEGILAD